ncbi:MAG: hypothetical protein ACOCXG_05795 [Nanoarchaeota archaeon]
MGVMDRAYEPKTRKIPNLDDLNLAIGYCNELERILSIHEEETTRITRV